MRITKISISAPLLFSISHIVYTKVGFIFKGGGGGGGRSRRVFCGERGVTLASNPGLPHTDFISQLWRKTDFFLQGCKIKSGRGRPGFEARGSL